MQPRISVFRSPQPSVSNENLVYEEWDKSRDKRFLAWDKRYEVGQCAGRPRRLQLFAFSDLSHCPTPYRDRVRDKIAVTAVPWDKKPGQSRDT